jgi:hypothetical protein
MPAQAGINSAEYTETPESIGIVSDAEASLGKYNSFHK